MWTASRTSHNPGTKNSLFRHTLLGSSGRHSRQRSRFVNWCLCSKNSRCWGWRDGEAVPSTICLLFQRTGVQFLASTSQFPIVGNSSSRDPDTLFWLPEHRHACAACCIGRHAGKTPVHMKKKKKESQRLVQDALLCGSPSPPCWPGPVALPLHPSVSQPQSKSL